MNLIRQLFQASRKDDLSQIKILIRKGADVHADNDFLLRWAAGNGHLEIVKYLVKHGADIHAVDDFALRMAAVGGYLEVVKYLVEHGTDVNDDTLSYVSRNGHHQVVKYFKQYIVSQFTKRHIDKLIVRYASEQYKLPFDIQQLISTYV